jgi:hypothetical protein
MSYLTHDELNAVHASGLDPFTPYVIDVVSRSQFSVARHFGGCTYGGREYYYIPTTDELVREDVVRWIMTRRKEAQRVAREAGEAQQMEML